MLAKMWQKAQDGSRRPREGEVATCARAATEDNDANVADKRSGCAVLMTPEPAAEPTWAKEAKEVAEKGHTPATAAREPVGGDVDRQIPETPRGVANPEQETPRNDERDSEPRRKREGSQRDEIPSPAGGAEAAPTPAPAPAEGGGTAAKGRKRERPELSPEQLAQLQEELDSECKGGLTLPLPPRIEALASALSLSRAQVRRWFQQQRAAKRQAVDARIARLLSENPRPDKRAREEVASELGYDVKQVDSWVAQHRKKAKAAHEEGGTGASEDAPAEAGAQAGAQAAAEAAAGAEAAGDAEPRLPGDEAGAGTVSTTPREAEVEAGLGAAEGSAAPERDGPGGEAAGSDGAADAGAGGGSEACDGEGAAPTPTDAERLTETRDCEEEMAALRAALRTPAFPAALVEAAVGEAQGRELSDTALAILVEGSTLPLTRLAEHVNAAAGVPDASVEATRARIVKLAKRRAWEGRETTSVEVDWESDAPGTLWRWEVDRVTLLPEGQAREEAKRSRAVARGASKRLRAVGALAAALERGGRGWARAAKRAREAMAKCDTLARVEAEAAAVAAEERARRERREEERRAKEAERERAKAEKQGGAEAKKAEKKAQSVVKAQERAERKAEKAAQKAGLGSAKSMKASASLLSAFVQRPAGAAPSPAVAVAADRPAPSPAAAPGVRDLSRRLSEERAREVDEAMRGGLPEEARGAAWEGLLGRWRREGGQRRRVWGRPPAWARRRGAAAGEDGVEAALVRRFGCGGAALRATASTHRRKFLWFAIRGDDGDVSAPVRPPFYGSWSRRPAACGPRCPFAREADGARLLTSFTHAGLAPPTEGYDPYDCLSDEDWEAEPEGEELGVEEDGEDLGAESEGDMSGVVEDGYLSADEGVFGEDETTAEAEAEVAMPAQVPGRDRGRAAAQAAMLEQLDARIAAGRHANRPVVVSRLAVPTSCAALSADPALLAALEAIVLCPGAIAVPAADADAAAGPAPAAGPSALAAGTAPAAKPGRAARPFPDSLLAPLLCHLACSTEGLHKSIDAFLAALASAPPSEPGFRAPSKEALRAKVREVAELIRGRWFLRKEAVESAGLTEAELRALPGAACEVRSAGALALLMAERANARAAARDGREARARGAEAGAGEAAVDLGGAPDEEAVAAARAAPEAAWAALATAVEAAGAGGRASQAGLAAALAVLDPQSLDDARVLSAAPASALSQLLNAAGQPRSAAALRQALARGAANVAVALSLRSPGAPGTSLSEAVAAAGAAGAAVSLAACLDQSMPDEGVCAALELGATVAKAAREEGVTNGPLTQLRQAMLGSRDLVPAAGAAAVHRGPSVASRALMCIAEMVEEAGDDTRPADLRGAATTALVSASSSHVGMRKYALRALTSVVRCAPGRSVLDAMDTLGETGGTPWAELALAAVRDALQAALADARARVAAEAVGLAEALVPLLVRAPPSLVASVRQGLEAVGALEAAGESTRAAAREVASCMAV